MAAVIVVVAVVVTLSSLCTVAVAAVAAVVVTATGDCSKAKEKENINQTVCLALSSLCTQGTKAEKKVHIYIYKQLKLFT